MTSHDLPWPPSPASRAQAGNYGALGRVSLSLDEPRPLVQKSDPISYMVHLLNDVGQLVMTLTLSMTSTMTSLVSGAVGALAQATEDVVEGIASLPRQVSGMFADRETTVAARPTAAKAKSSACVLL